MRTKERKASSLYDRATSAAADSPHVSRPASAHLAYPLLQGVKTTQNHQNGGFTPPPDRWAVPVEQSTFHELSQRLSGELLALESERQNLKTNLSRGGSGVNARKNREAAETKLDDIEKSIGRLRMQMKDRGML